ncbi:apoptotic chromatin condensation inducer acinus [Brevipalpus obovatus]|uniref:apoptotic chromatin condensation inducer acinus n=1 Tax=Brevipalpus obovatus TaxID=246614 RepID=UPI003D9E092A
MTVDALRDKFLYKLQQIYDSQGIPLRTSIAVAKQPLDLYLLFMIVREKGGYGPVCHQKLWKDITTACNIKANPSSANSVKNHYMKHLLDFENELETFVLELSSAAPQHSTNITTITTVSAPSTQQADSTLPEQLVHSQHLSAPPYHHPQFPVESNLHQSTEAPVTIEPAPLPSPQQTDCQPTMIQAQVLTPPLVESHAIQSSLINSEPIVPPSHEPSDAMTSRVIVSESSSIGNENHDAINKQADASSSQQAEPTAQPSVKDEICISKSSVDSSSEAKTLTPSGDQLSENIPEEENLSPQESPVITSKPIEIPSLERSSETINRDPPKETDSALHPSQPEERSKCEEKEEHGEDKMEEENVVNQIETETSKLSDEKKYPVPQKESSPLPLAKEIVKSVLEEIPRPVSEEVESQKSSASIVESSAHPHASNAVTDKTTDSKENQDKEPRQIKRRIEREEPENEKVQDKSRDENSNNSSKRERKRRWGSSTGLGTASSVPPKQPTGISSSALKVLIPELNKSHSQVSKTTEEQSQEVKGTTSTTTPIAQDIAAKEPEQPSEAKTTIQDIDESSNLSENKSNRISRSISMIDNKADTSDDIKPSGNLVVTGKSSVDPAKDSEQEASPAKNPASNIIFIRNLVRPFTLIQLKELLNRTGKLIEEKFWIDKIKSKCYASYETQDEAIATRDALHGTRWPDANPKKLAVDFADEDELNFHLNSDDPSRTSLGDSKSSNLEDGTKMGKSSDSIGPEKYDAAIRRGRTEDGDRINDSKKEDRRERSDAEKRPIREWDREKFDSRSQNDNQPPSKRRKEASSGSENRDRNDQNRGRDKDQRKSKENRESQEGAASSSENRLVDDKGPMVKLLDDLFHKTKATPCIYWLPLDEEQAKKRAELREQNARKREEEFANREAERRTRMEERRRSPFVRRDRSPAWRGRDHGWNRRSRPYQRRSRSPMRSRRSFPRSRSRSVSKRRSRSRSVSKDGRARSISRSRSRSRSR